MTPEQLQGLRLARVLLANGIPLDQVCSNPAIPAGARDLIRTTLEQERISEEERTIRPLIAVSANPNAGRWLDAIDRNAWYYTPSLRDYLLSRGWNQNAFIDLDRETDGVLRELCPPDTAEFNRRGLVLGYVQSGKTANFTALIAKAVDVGYRLVIVLSGIDNGLRRQTQIRLNRELVGYSNNAHGPAVPLPPPGYQWHQFTNEEVDGDFDAGRANYGALQGSQPVLIVMKKNGHRLRRLLEWLRQAPAAVAQTLPTLVIDDEADQASVDTQGERVNDSIPPDEIVDDPSVINGLIRQLLGRFRRCAYVAYTATPYANILIPHDNVHPEYGEDLYPRDFFIALDKRPGYCGAEEYYGRLDRVTNRSIPGLGVVELVGDADLDAIDNDEFPPDLKKAFADFVLAGAARRLRGDGDAPATMLIHTSARQDDHRNFARQTLAYLNQKRDEWRYQREYFEPELRSRWDEHFRHRIQTRCPENDVPFDALIPSINVFLSELQEVREINSRTGEVLDYNSEPNLKVIAVGGNRLARGLTLEGLLVSYFVRRTPMYDTLMQMGRWFGYRGGYADLTRVYTTSLLNTWFYDLATVEHQLREDIGVYARNPGVTPRDIGLRILRHPAMMLTSRLKQRHSQSLSTQQTFAGTVAQLFKFPFDRPQALAEQADANLSTVRGFLHAAGRPSPATESRSEGPIWDNVPGGRVVQFLQTFQVDDGIRTLSMEHLAAYVQRQIEAGELIQWTVAVMGRKTTSEQLGYANWVSGVPIRQISRTRLTGPADLNSVGVITSTQDELVGLSEDQIANVRQRCERDEIGPNPASRYVRSPEQGLLLLYPISRYSIPRDSGDDESARQRLYADPEHPLARDLIAFAISFPHSQNAETLFGNGSVDWVTGTVTWKSIE